MAQRRMFSKSITNSSQFLMMPASSQNLYFHLGMNADDDGFCEHFALMRMTDSKPDDLKILQAKGFVTIFDDKVLVICDWKENNYLRSDRYTPSKYLNIYKAELAKLSSGIPVVDQTATQVRLGKVRKGKVKEQYSEAGASQVDSKEISDVIDTFRILNDNYSKWFKNTTQRKACAELIEKYSVRRVLKAVYLAKFCFADKFFPSFSTPYELVIKWTKVMKYYKGKLTDKRFNEDFEKYMVEMESQKGGVKNKAIVIDGIELAYEVSE